MIQLLVNLNEGCPKFCRIDPIKDGSKLRITGGLFNTI